MKQTTSAFPHLSLDGIWGTTSSISKKKTDKASYIIIIIRFLSICNIVKTSSHSNLAMDLAIGESPAGNRDK